MRRPLREPFFLVQSVGIGVTSSIRPILRPPRASARSAAWAPGPGVLLRVPPTPRILMWRPLMFFVFRLERKECFKNKMYNCYSWQTLLQRPVQPS